jgi:CheY-like chemotaxis protein/HPt (histidine-containing phosphotransfer) domain-containing protein
MFKSRGEASQAENSSPPSEEVNPQASFPASPQVTVAPAVKGVHILVAEDNPVNQKVALRHLQRLGYQADAVANGLEVLEALTLVPYDIILMDCQMPEMDGFEATTEVRRREGEERRTPIIAMTANALKGDRERCLEAGMDDYISKPVKTEDLSALLHKWVRVAQTHKTPLANKTRQADREDFISAIEPEKLREFDELTGENEPSLVIEVIDLFLSDAPPRMAELRGALEQNDGPRVERAAHTLKGSSSHFGAKTFGAICLKLEQMGHENQVASAHTLLPELEQEFSRLERALQQEKAKRLSQ